MGQSGRLLRELEADLLAGKPLADLLRKVILFGGRVGSPELREWASQELKGFQGVERLQLPTYRVIRAPVLLDAVVGFNQVTRFPVPESALPDWVDELDLLPLRQGVRELEAMAEGGQEMRFGVPGADVLGSYLDQRSDQADLQTTYAIYWVVSPVTFAGVVDQIRTALSELVGELVAADPDTETDPTPSQIDQAVAVAIYGDKARVHVSQAGAAGPNTAATSSLVDPEEGPSWWTKGRRIGAVVVGLATIVAAVAAVLVLF